MNKTYVKEHVDLLDFFVVQKQRAQSYAVEMETCTSTPDDCKESIGLFLAACNKAIIREQQAIKEGIDNALKNT